MDRCVKGIRGRSKGGTTVTEAGRIIIGADGVDSLVVRTVHPPTYNEKPSLACWYYTYWSGVPVEGGELYPLDGRMVLCELSH